MRPLELLKSVAPLLEQAKASYALCGGIAATIYRSKPRLTNDVDIALAGAGAEALAKRLIKQLGLKQSVGWIAGARERLGTSVPLLIGHQGDAEESTVDFLLPAFPWLETAVERAATHKIDFEFAQIPTLLPEDVIIAKLFALNIEATRFSDMDDIQSILRSKTELDIPYLSAEMDRLRLRLPQALHESAPKALRRR